MPAVKPAAERSRSRVVGLIGSAGCVEDPYLDDLVGRYANGVEVLREGAQALVAFVERRAAVASEAERREAVEPFVRPLVERGADEIVLACTHFLHVSEAIAAVSGPGVEVVHSPARAWCVNSCISSRTGTCSREGRLKTSPTASSSPGRLPLRRSTPSSRKAFGLSGPEPLLV